VTTPLPDAKPEIKALAKSLTPKTRAGDFAQGLMDLGATLCTPRRPACGLCPMRIECRGLAEGIAEALPLREERTERPVRRGVTFVALREDGAVLLRERPLRGLLGGMLETPSSPWAEGEGTARSGTSHAPLKAEWKKLPGLVEHTFTHFHLELSVYRADVGLDAELKRAARPERCRWLSPRDFTGAALPSVMRKVLAHALGEDELRPARKPA
jgi:A/G-specific adenine glycosylase